MLNALRGVRNPGSIGGLVPCGGARAPPCCRVPALRLDAPDHRARRRHGLDRPHREPVRRLGSPAERRLSPAGLLPPKAVSGRLPPARDARLAVGVLGCPGHRRRRRWTHFVRAGAAVHRRHAGRRAARPSGRRRVGRRLGGLRRRRRRSVGGREPADDPDGARPRARGPLGRRVRRDGHRPTAPGPVRGARLVGGLLRPRVPRRPVRARGQGRPRRPHTDAARAARGCRAAPGPNTLLYLGRGQPRRRPHAVVGELRAGAAGARAAVPALAPPRRGPRALLASDAPVRAALRGSRILVLGDSRAGLEIEEVEQAGVHGQLDGAALTCSGPPVHARDER